MKPTIPQGTRDFAPETVRKRQYIFQTIRGVFERYGFQPLETPAMENLDTLMGKYGDEGDKLIFKILNNGLDHPNKRDQALTDFQRVLEGKSVKAITERALRYDLTIPFARFVAMNHGQLSFPFKRYQIQPVWRADRPQKGRYREFYQCDADVVGSASLINEAELAAIYRDVFTSLGLSVDIRINHRKILAALAEQCGGPDQMMAITMAIDKLDKIGLDGVKKELQDRGLTDAQISIITQFLDISGSVDEKIAAADALIGQLESGKQGLAELRWLMQFLRSQDSPCPVSVDFTLARGLNYYTGTIFEVKANGVQMGSIGGGGRYDDLTGLFGVSGIPGVGISFGVDRIYDVMEELGLFPEELAVGTRVLFFNLGEAEAVYAYSLLQQVRSKGIPAEIFHENSKFDKQFKYAEKKRIPFIVISGSAEMETQTCVVKNLQTGEQQNIPAAELPAWLSRAQG
jgi:histidyl-tRNA synthetase